MKSSRKTAPFKKNEEEKKKEKNLQAHKLPVQKLYESSL